VPGYEPLPGVRVVADPAVIDALVAALPTERRHLRLAPDDVLVVGTADVAVDDPDAIVEPEAGFVAAEVDLAVVARHMEWPIPIEWPALAQGAIAGVPARLSLLGDDGRATLITAAAYADELAKRLGLAT
jgi:hypothetical protein